MHIEEKNKLAILLPSQTWSDPGRYPVLHSHVKLPYVLKQVPSPQGFECEHSLTSFWINT